MTEMMEARRMDTCVNKTDQWTVISVPEEQGIVVPRKGVKHF